MSVPTDPTSITALCDQLDQLRATAMPGPWGLERDRTGGYDLTRPDGDFLADPLGALSEDDAALIVAAVNAVPRLTAALRAVEALADEWDNFYGGPGEFGLGREKGLSQSAADLRAALAAGAGQ